MKLCSLWMLALGAAALMAQDGEALLKERLERNPAWKRAQQTPAYDAHAPSGFVLDEAEKYQNKFQAVQDNLKNNYGENSNDHFWRLYDEYRQQGYGDRQAAILAGRETTVYQQKRKDYLVNAINEYGIVNGNSLNQFGVNTLAQIAEEDNIMGTAIAQGFETPKGNYEKQQAMLQEILRQTSANQRKQAEIAYNTAIQKILETGRYVRQANDIASKEGIAKEKEAGLNARTEYTEKNKFDLEELRQKNRKELEQIKAELKDFYSSKKSGDSSKGSSKEDYTRLKDLQSRLHTKWKDAKSEEEPDEDYVNEIAQELERVDSLLKTYQDPALNQVFPDATGNPEEDLAVIRALINGGATSSEIHTWGRKYYDSNTLHKMIERFSK